MDQKITNLQNAPDSGVVTTEAVNFDSNGVRLKGTIFRPEFASPPYEAVIVTGAWTTVKEQMAGTYARELAARGWLALAFDFSGWGESEGDPRFVEDPVVKTADIHAAATFLITHNDVNPARISGLGICASSGYMAEAVATDDRLKKLAMVAPWLHDADVATIAYGGPDAVAGLIAKSDPATEEAGGRVLVAASTTDSSAPMYQAPYYTEEHRGLIPQYDNKFNLLTWKRWLTYDALASAGRLTKPTLMVGSSGMALPIGAASYARRMATEPKKVWLGDDVGQFDFYDRADIVAKSTDAVAAFFAE